MRLISLIFLIFLLSQTSIAQQVNNTPKSKSPKASTSPQTDMTNPTHTNVQKPTASGKAGFAIGDHLYVQTPGLNGRGGPGTSFKVLTVFQKGEKLLVWQYQGRWVRVGEEVWVVKKGLNTTP